MLVGIAIGVAATAGSSGQDTANSVPVDDPTVGPTQVSTAETTPGTATPRPTPTVSTPTPQLIAFTGRGEKATDTFTIRGSRFRVHWTTEVTDPNAFFFLSVFRVGQTFPVAEASFRGSGSDETIVRAGAGQFYLQVITGAAWRIEITSE